MTLIKLLFPILSSLLLAAHFSRISNNWLALVCIIIPLLLFSKKRWVMRLFQLFLIFGGIIWIERTIDLVQLRQRLQQPWIRLAVILIIVASVTILSSFVFNSKKMKDIFKKGQIESTIPVIISVLLTAGLLSIVQIKVKTPVLLLMERFQPGAGWLEVFLLAFYAGWITEKLINPKKIAVIRSRIWLLFSTVFFLQLLLGVLGIEKLLMTGKLHLPVPAMIIAGPLFRGEGFFMVILIGVTLLLVGPAWCSYLCYIGAWDNFLARKKKHLLSLPPWRHSVRLGILISVPVVAILLKISGVSGLIATILGALFGIVGVGVMVFISRKKGIMVHCTAFCPIGLVADWLGRLSPFRLRINENCSECGACRTACRYDALNISDIQKRKPGLTCTLCGDCISRCADNALEYKYFKLNSQTAYYFFIILVVSLHAVFLGVARL